MTIFTSLYFRYNQKKGHMPVKIKISVKDIVLDAEPFDTARARAVAGALPIEAEPDEWGDEFYFEAPVRMPLDKTATTEVSVGDIGYWPPGSALEIFFGPTPMSTGSDPVPASSVNLVGRISGDATLLKKAKGTKGIRIERSE
jgi:hypothetical protein